MRMSIPLLAALTLTTLTLAATLPRPAAAQEPSAYAWCGLYPNDIGGQNCYFRSQAECLTTMSGIGGVCTPSPYYRARASAEPEQRRARHHSHPAHPH